MTRTKLLLAAGALAVNANLARAQSCDRDGDAIIASCDAAFGGAGLLITSARGWCYLLNAVACALP